MTVTIVALFVALAALIISWRSGLLCRAVDRIDDAIVHMTQNEWEP